jgi:hypothetical protein
MVSPVSGWALKEEHMANDHHLAVKARTDFGDRFEELFEYRRGGDSEHLVRNKDLAVARRYHDLQSKSKSLPRVASPSKPLPHPFA